MDAVLTQLRSEGCPVKPQDEVRLSPFGHEHINMLERYSFSVPESVAQGDLRPLHPNNPESAFAKLENGCQFLVGRGVH